MALPHIVLSRHVQRQMRRRGVSLEDVGLVLNLGEHVEGRMPGTEEACAELDGRPLTVVYDAATQSIRRRISCHHRSQKKVHVMRITYDRDVDVLSILLADADVEETRNIAPGVEVDYDSSGRVVGIEFIKASQSYDVDWREFDPPDPYYSLAEAGYLHDLSPDTLRHQIQRGVLPGKKFGRNWMVHIDDLEEYLAKRSRKKRAARAGPAGADRGEGDSERGNHYEISNRKAETVYAGPVSADRIRERRGTYKVNLDDRDGHGEEP